MSLIDWAAEKVDNYTAAGGPLQTYLNEQRAVEEADYYAQAYRACDDAGMSADKAAANAEVATARHYGEVAGGLAELDARGDEDDAADAAIEEATPDDYADADVDAA